MSRIPRFACVALAAAVLLPQGVLADATPAAKTFAAPATAASLPTSGASGIGQVTLALLLVLAAVSLLRRQADWRAKLAEVEEGEGSA